jgi:hypothetical protein
VNNDKIARLTGDVKDLERNITNAQRLLKEIKKSLESEKNSRFYVGQRIMASNRPITSSNPGFLRTLSKIEGDGYCRAMEGRCRYSHFEPCEGHENWIKMEKGELYPPPKQNTKRIYLYESRSGGMNTVGNGKTVAFRDINLDIKWLG